MPRRVKEAGRANRRLRGNCFFFFWYFGPSLPPVEQVYASAVGPAGLPKSKDRQGGDVEAGQLDAAAALAHACEHERYYATELGMPAALLVETARELEAAVVLAAPGCSALGPGAEVAAGVLERALANAERLAARARGAGPEANVQALRRQWDAHEEAKRLRMGGPSSGPASAAGTPRLSASVQLAAMASPRRGSSPPSEGSPDARPRCAPPPSPPPLPSFPTFPLRRRT